MLLTLLVKLRHVIGNETSHHSVKWSFLDLWLIATIVNLCNYQPRVISNSLWTVNYTELHTGLLNDKYVEFIIIVLWHVEHNIWLINASTRLRSNLNLMDAINLNIPLYCIWVDALETFSLIIRIPYIHKSLSHMWSSILWIKICYDSHALWFIQKCYPRGSLSSSSCSLSSCKFRLSHLVPFKRALISWSKSTTL